MITVTHYRNHLLPMDRVSLTAEAGTSLRTLARSFSDTDEWPHPTIALVDGSPWLRERWSEPLHDGAIVEFRTLPQGSPKTTGYIIGGAMIAAGVATMILTGWTGIGIAAGTGLILGGLGSMYGASQMQAPPGVPSYMGGDAGSPTYSIGYKSNRKRVGESIPVLYGRHRLFPDLITPSHVWYQDNDQYVAAVICLGAGEFDVDTTTLRFGEAKFSELSGINYEIVPPGGTLTLCADHVTTSEAVSGQTLLGPAPNIALQGAPRVAFSSYNDGTSDHAVLAASSGIFGGLTAGDSIITTGTANYNGTFIVETVDAANQITVAFTGVVADESPLAAVVTKSPSSPLIVLPASLVFTTGVRKIESASGAGAFTGVKVTDYLVIANTASNNGAFLVESVADDLSYLIVQEAITNETALNADVGFDNAGWTGWFEAAGGNDEVQSIAVDLAAARGLGTLNGSGGISSRTITVTVQYQGLDGAGAAIGSVGTRTIVITAAQQKAVRRTEQWTNDTTYPRVRLRVRRTTSASTNTSALDEMVWAGLKAYLPPINTYPGVTILAVTAKASEQLTGQQSGQINVEAIRKLPIWSGSAWSAPTATSSIAWALADVLRDSTYGAGLASDEIDFAALLALDAVWSARGDEFNAVFDQALTIWEAVQKIASAGRAQPVLAGGVVTFVRDGEKPVRTAMFTPSNMLPGSLAIDYRLPQDGDPDGTSAAWMNPTTWQPSHIDLTEGGGTPIKPAAVDLFGVTNEAQASRDATYLDRLRKYQRKSLRWSTEMDGHLVSVGDRVVVAHDVPAWGQSGELLDLAGSTFTSSQELTWTPSVTHYALFRRPDGSVAGPFMVTQHGSDPYRFDCSSSLDFTPRTDLSNGDRTSFIFGPSTNYAQDVVIVSVSPRDAVTVDLQGVPYDPRIHAAGA